MNVEQARFNMIEQQIRPWDVLDAAVLDLLAMVRREDFVSPAYRTLAFVDMELPLVGVDGQATGQFMLAPKVEARLLQELAVQKHEKVLEIGSGSGFMAALLGHRGLTVTTVESRAPLAALARQNLQRAAVHNVSVVEGDGARFSGTDGLFDAIVLSGSVAVPPPSLLAQLKPGGRLLAIVGYEPVMRAQLWRDGACRILFDTVAPRLDGFAEPSPFTF